MDRWTDKQADGQTLGGTNSWIDGRTDCMVVRDGLTDILTARQMDGETEKTRTSIDNRQK